MLQLSKVSDGVFAMAVEFEHVVAMVEQLSESEQKALFVRLLQKTHRRLLNVDERRLLFDTMRVDLGAVSPEYSDRREDWYD